MVGEVLKAIAARQNFLLTSHARPDGDAVGSVLACAQILQALGKRTEVVMADPVPHLYRNLPQAKRVRRAGEVSGNYEAAMLLECDGVARTHIKGLEKHFLINIDHHSSGKPFANVNWIDPSACATAEMVHKLARDAGVRITPEIATCLYTAVLTDTGSFAFPGTNERTFELAQELVRAGADPVAIAQGIYFDNPLQKTRLLGAALRNLQRCHQIAWMHVTRDDMRQAKAGDEDCEGLVNYALGNEGVEVAAFFREMGDGRWRVSLRSKGAVNVAALAESFGGGGHECAAGMSMAGTLDEISGDILKQLEAALASSPRKQQ